VLLPPPRRTLVGARLLAIVRITEDANVHVIVMGFGPRGLLQDRRRSRDQPGIFARGARFLQQPRRQVALDEDPLNLRPRIRQQRSHQPPVAPRIEPDLGDPFSGRPAALGRRPAEASSRPIEVKHHVGGHDWRAVGPNRVVEEVHVAPALMRLVLG